MKFNTIPEIIKDLKKGKLVIVVDDEDRENEGDLVVAASMAGALCVCQWRAAGLMNWTCILCMRPIRILLKLPGLFL